MSCKLAGVDFLSGRGAASTLAALLSFLATLVLVGFFSIFALLPDGLPDGLPAGDLDDNFTAAAFSRKGFEVAAFGFAGLPTIRFATAVFLPAATAPAGALPATTLAFALPTLPAATLTIGLTAELGFEREPTTALADIGDFFTTLPPVARLLATAFLAGVETATLAFFFTGADLLNWVALADLTALDGFLVAAEANRFADFTDVFGCFLGLNGLHPVNLRAVAVGMVGKTAKCVKLTMNGLCKTQWSSTGFFRYNRKMFDRLPTLTVFPVDF